MVQTILNIIRKSTFENRAFKAILIIWALFMLYLGVSIGSHWLVETYWPHLVLKIQLYPWYSLTLFGVLYAFNKVFLKNIEI
jgi:hypothetical protein